LTTGADFKPALFYIQPASRRAQNAIVDPVFNLHRCHFGILHFHQALHVAQRFD
jgi:hypothetical protein